MTAEKPSYRLVPIVNTPTVNPGGTIEIAIHCVGYGEVEKADLTVSYGHPNLVDPNDVGRFITTTSWKMGGNSAVPVPILGYVYVSPISDLSPTKIGIRHLFTDYQALEQIANNTNELLLSQDLSNTIQKTKQEGMYSPLLFDRDNSLIPSNEMKEMGISDDREQIEDYESFERGEGNQLPVLKLELDVLPSSSLSTLGTLGKTADPGNYDISFVLTYGDDSTVYQDKTEVQVHVNNFVEKNSTLLRTLGLFLAAVAALAAIPIAVDGLTALYDLLYSLAPVGGSNSSTSIFWLLLWVGSQH